MLILNILIIKFQCKILCLLKVSKKKKKNKYCDFYKQTLQCLNTSVNEKQMTNLSVHR